MADVSVNGRKVKVRELTVREIREWFKSLAARKEDQFDVVNETLFEDVTLEDLCLMTDLEKGEVDNLTPSQAGAVLQKVKEVNSDFFAQRLRIRKAGAALAEGNEAAGGGHLRGGGSGPLRRPGLPLEPVYNCY